MFCHKCGSKVDDDARFCHKCGAKVDGDTVPLTQMETVQPPSSNNKSTEELLKESMIAAMARCVSLAILGLLFFGPGIVGIFGIYISLTEGIDTETFIVSLFLGVFLTPVSIVTIIAAIRCGKQYVSFKKQRKEAIDNDRFIY